MYTLLYDWELWARTEQLEPKIPWSIWLLLTGRGWGKTLTGAQTIRHKIETEHVRHTALVGPTIADVRDVMAGLDPDSSGLLQVCPPWNKPVYEPSKRHLIWPDGAVATLYSSEEPKRLRGPQHELGWGDEPAAWENAEDTLSNLLFGLRRGKAQLVLTGTPEPVKIIKDLVRNPDIIITRGSMFDNPTLSPLAIKRIKDQYEGTRLGRQEIYGELLEDNPDALWTEKMIEDDRLTVEEFEQRVATGIIKIKRTVVSIDPAVTNTKSSNETGITVECIDTQDPPHGYLLDDESLVGRPDQWSRVAVALFNKRAADRVIGEVNNGGDLIEHTIRQVPGAKSIPYKAVRATKGKILRAEPVSALYEKHRIHHVGRYARLEAQMCDYNGSQIGVLSPDRLDSLVWGFTELMLSGRRGGGFMSW